MRVVFKTPGLLDIRAFTMMGLTAKPNSTNPIGRFGTGLKYAIAVLLRHGASVSLYIDGVEYVFYLKELSFRGKALVQVLMRKRKGLMAKWQHVQLPFTTEYGKDWEMWQAFRELHSNTLDENGETYATRLWPTVEDSKGQTIITVDHGHFHEVFKSRNKIFLDPTKEPRDESAEVQVFNEPSKHIYWRGVRVYDLEKPSIYTYNILKDLELTEDRTAKSMFTVKNTIGTHVAESQNEEVIEAVISAKADHFEGQIDFDFVYGVPSDTFNKVVARHKHTGLYYRASVGSYYDRYAPKVPEVELGLHEEIIYQLNMAQTNGQVRLAKLLTRLSEAEIIEREPVAPALPNPAVEDDDDILF